MLNLRIAYILSHSSKDLFLIKSARESSTYVENRVNGLNTGLHGKQKQILKDLNELAQTNDEETNNEDDIEQYTCIKSGYVTHDSLPDYISLKSLSTSQDKVPKLKHNLNSTLFSPGIHYLSDPRTGVFNFDLSLGNIPHINQYKMDKISSFTPSSRDTKLTTIADFINNDTSPKHPDPKGDKISYFSSTSSMTGILTKFHRLLSNNRPINTSTFSKFYPDKTNFTKTMDVPTSVVLTPKNDTKTLYSLDADRSTDSEITLSILGNALELMLTKDPKDFRHYLKSSTKDPEEDKSAYHYAKIGKFLVRSQLDASHMKLPGKGTFDIKTRAVCAIRFDLNHTDHYPTNYEINKTYGLFESFERELFDAARIVMFKYSLQARLGNMDGIFMAFHNIKKFLGFQYLPLTDIDNYFFGELIRDDQKYGNDLLKKKSDDEDDNELLSISEINQLKLQEIVDDFGNHHQNKREALSSYVADQELKISMNLLQKLLDEIIKETKGRPFRMMFKKMKSGNIQPKAVVEEDLESVNELNAEQETKYEEREYSQNNMIILVNTLEEHELESLQMLTNERVEQSKTIVDDVQNKVLSVSERIKLFARYASDFRNGFFKVNRSILKNSGKNDGFFAYELKVDHYFDGKKCTSKYPMPSTDILDKEKNYKWDFKYSISKINRDADKKYLYSKFIRNIGFNSFRSSDVDDEFKLFEKHEVKFDENATALQNITRAYSAKAFKRQETYTSADKNKKNKNKSKKFNCINRTVHN
jgi:hypothetical protein